MRYTVNKDKWNKFVFFIPILIFFFFTFIILINKKFIEKINTIMLKNYPHYIITKSVYYGPLNSKNFIIYDNKPIMAIGQNEIYNKYLHITLSNGIAGWVKKKSFKTLYNWTISIKENNLYKFYHLISLKIKDQKWILKVLDNASWPAKIKIITIDNNNIHNKLF